MGDTALLVMDVQRDIVERYVTEPTYLSTLARAISQARSAGIPVIYLTISVRRNYPEISERNSSFARVVVAGRLIEGDPGTKIHPVVAPASGDVKSTGSIAVSICKWRASPRVFRAAFIVHSQATPVRTNGPLGVAPRSQGAGRLVESNLMRVDMEGRQAALKAFPREFMLDALNLLLNEIDKFPRAPWRVT